MNLSCHLIINGDAGGGRGAAAEARLTRLLDARGWRYSVYRTEFAGHESEIAENLARCMLAEWSGAENHENFPLMVVVGGDGTLHNALNAVGSGKIPAAYIPVGSGNDFARGAGISLETEAAFGQIARAEKPNGINVVRYEEKNSGASGFFINNLGVGLDAAIVAAANRSPLKKTLNMCGLGRFAYIFSAFKALAALKIFPLTVEADGARHDFQNTFLAVAANHMFCGGGVPLAPPADAREPAVDFVLAEHLSWPETTRLLPRVLSGTHLSSPRVRHFKCKELRVSSPGGEIARHTDGEILPDGPFELVFTTETRFFWF